MNNLYNKGDFVRFVIPDEDFPSAGVGVIIAFDMATDGYKYKIQEFLEASKIYSGLYIVDEKEILFLSNKAPDSRYTS